MHATFWLLNAPDSLAVQARRDPDGTGLGYYDRKRRLVVHRCPLPAYEDQTFVRMARRASSRTFIAHVRFASGSPVSLDNTHPFQQHDRLFGHNGLLRGVDELEAELGPYMSLVQGDTDSERFFALITREIERAEGDVTTGLQAAASWVAEHLPIYALNLVLTTTNGIWALRYPDTHELLVLERAAGGRQNRHFDGTSVSGFLRVHSMDLLGHPAVVVASEALDDSQEWRPLEPGELVHVGPDLVIASRLALPGPPAHRLTYADLHPEEAASQAA